MPVIPFPYIQNASVGDVPINLYPAIDSNKKEILKGTFGLSAFSQLTNCSEGRGIYSWGGYLYCVIRRGSTSVVWRVDPSLGSSSEIGTITTSFTGPVWMINNPDQLCIVDGVSGWVYTPQTGQFVQITDSSFPGASGLDYIEGVGLFVQPDSIEWFYSNLFDFTTFPTGNYIGFESKAVEKVVSILMFTDQILVLADTATEVWSMVDTGGSLTASPFQRNSYGFVEYGCGAAGSVNTANGTVPNWISDQGQWVMLAGYAGTVISTPMFDRAVQAMPLFSDAQSFSWRDDGHLCTAMTFPTGGQTWVMDWTMKVLFKLTSYLADGSGWGRHRLSCITKCANQLFGLDYENGTVYKVSRDYKDDAGKPIQRILHSVEWETGTRETIDFGPLTLLMKMGVGLVSGQGSDPQVIRQFSNDSGNTWSNELWRSLGKIGSYGQPPPIWQQNGVSRKRIERFIITDPVEVEVRGCQYDIKVLKS